MPKYGPNKDVFPVTKITSKHYPANIFMFKVNNKSPWKRRETGSNLEQRLQEQGHWRRSGVFNFWFCKYFTPFSSVSVADFELINVYGVQCKKQ